jgi:acetyl esterase
METAMPDRAASGPPAYPPLAVLIAEIEAGRAPGNNPEHDTAHLVAAFPALAAVDVVDIAIPGPHGEVSARRYLPPAGPAPDAALVWAHGGAFLGGDLDMPESNWVGLALAASGIPVLALDYRKAIRGIHYPIPSDDVLAGWRWAAAHAGDLGVGADALHFGGASAGGNLTAGVAKRLRDAGEALPASLLLLYPALHAHCPEPSAELRAAIAAVPEMAPLDAGAMGELNLNYVGTAEALDDPYAFPATGNVGGLPPTLVVASELDWLRASAEPFAADLAAAGNRVRYEVVAGSPHGQLNEPFSVSGPITIELMRAWLAGGWREA